MFHNQVFNRKVPNYNGNISTLYQTFQHKTFPKICYSVLESVVGKSRSWRFLCWTIRSGKNFIWVGINWLKLGSIDCNLTKASRLALIFSNLKVFKLKLFNFKLFDFKKNFQKYNFPTTWSFQLNVTSRDIRKTWECL